MRAVAFAMAVGLAALSSVACQALLNTQTDATSTQDAATTPSEADATRARDAGDAGVAHALACDGGLRACETLRACVSPTSPAFGCGSASCEACPSKNAKSVQCIGAPGQPGTTVCDATCLPGFKHCVDAGTSCETAIDKADSCGDCLRACPKTMACASVGSGFDCVNECPPGQQLCGQQCVFLMTNPEHCGDCSSACPAPPPNGRAVCESGLCASVCDLGFHLCAGTCASDTEARACGPGCIDCTNSGIAHVSGTCQQGTCSYSCDPGWSECDGVAENGCETEGYCTVYDPSTGN